MNCEKRLALGCILMGCIQLATIPAIANPGSIIIIVQQEPIVTPSGAPRSPIVNPFFGELLDGNGFVLLGATNPCGTVSIEITSSAGDNYSTYFDTSDGAILLPISGNEGYYTLTIITPYGTHYVGEFNI